MSVQVAPENDEKLVSKVNAELIASCIKPRRRSLQDGQAVLPNETEMQFARCVWKRLRKNPGELLLAKDIWRFVLEVGRPCPEKEIDVVWRKYDTDSKGGWDVFDFVNFWRRVNYFDEKSEVAEDVFT